MTNTDKDYIKALRAALLERETDKVSARNERWLSKRISDKIELALGSQIEEEHLGKGAPHPDTIRNFLNENTDPSPRILNIISWYLHNDHTSLFTFEEFKKQYDRSGIEPSNEHHQDEAIPAQNKEEEPLPITSKPQLTTILQKPLRIKNYWLIALAFCIVIASSYLLPDNNTDPFTQTFVDSNLEHLQDRGWFLFPDSIDLDKWDNPNYQGNGFLTLETHLGGSWLENRNYEPKSINILARKVKCGTCCVLKTKIVDFNPYQRYQQAGFFLFYEEKEYPSLLYTLETNEHDVKVQAIRRDGEYLNINIIDSKKYGHRSRISKFVHDEQLDGIVAENKIDSIVLKLIIEDDQYFFEYKTDEGEWQPIASKSIPFGAPKYVGLVAYQGRPDLPTPVWPVADIIPAKFATFSLSECDD